MGERARAISEDGCDEGEGGEGVCGASHADADGGAPVGEVEEVQGDEEHEGRDNALLGEPLDGGMG